MAQGLQKGLQTWRSGKGERQWLLRLIETMEQIARPTMQSRPVDRLVLARVRAQLGRPASCPYGAVGYAPLTMTCPVAIADHRKTCFPTDD